MGKYSRSRCYAATRTSTAEAVYNTGKELPATLVASGLGPLELRAAKVLHSRFRSEVSSSSRLQSEAAYCSSSFRNWAASLPRHPACSYYTWPQMRDAMQTQHQSRQCWKVREDTNRDMLE